MASALLLAASVFIVSEWDPECGHLSVHIQKRFLIPHTGSINHRGLANDLPGIVDAVGHTRSYATEGSQVGHLSIAVEEGISDAILVRPANHLAGVVDSEGLAFYLSSLTVERAQGGHHSVYLQKCKEKGGSGAGKRRV